MPRLIDEGIQVDSVVTDPPYHLTSIVKRFGKPGSAPVKIRQIPGQRGSPFARSAKGFMGKQWDGGDIAFQAATWALCFDLLRPGGHILVFGIPRAHHRAWCAIEDAGFEIRDTVLWLFGSGFPKSHDVSKGIDRAAGVERIVVGSTRFDGISGKANLNVYGAASRPPETAPATDAARQWQGWGTALKPAFEAVLWAQKPYQNSDEWVTISSELIKLWSQLWSLLPANIAEKNLGLSPSGCEGDGLAGAQWTAAERDNIRDGLCAQMDTSQFALATITSLSTVSSWADILAAVWGDMNTSTTKTALSTTTELRTLKSCLSAITPESIILAHSRGRWLSADASPAARLSAAIIVRWSGTLEHIALDSVSNEIATFTQDAGGQIEPPCEFICLARKPLIGAVAENVLEHGTGALNIDGCRIEAAADYKDGGKRFTETGMGYMGGHQTRPWVQAAIKDGRAVKETKAHDKGRWPANCIHDGSEEVLEAFARFGNLTSGTGAVKKATASGHQGTVYGQESRPVGTPNIEYGDTGTAARFFYTSKADKTDRCGSKHPTVKPLDLIQYLVRLITPPGGTVLDPFAGTGTTGEAAQREGFDAILIEREAEYVGDIEKRLSRIGGGDTPLFQTC